MGRSNNSFQNYFINPLGGTNLKMEPEQKLFVAVLTQAVHDAFKTADKLDKDTARSWLLGNSRDFRNICEFAGRDPAYVRERIKNKVLKEKGWRVI
jgi:hypothetical protein